MFTAEQSINSLPTNNYNQATDMNFAQIDSGVLNAQTNKLRSEGFSFEGLKTQYEDIKNQIGLDFGVPLTKLPDEVYSGKYGKGSKYVDKRLEVLNQLIKLFQSAQTPEDKHKIVALMELSKKASGGVPNIAIHNLEIIEAAKVAMKGDSEAESNFKQFDKSVIYDDVIFNKTLTELINRKEHLNKIKAHGYSTPDDFGFLGRVNDHGFQVAMQATSAFSVYKMLKDPKQVLDILKGNDITNVPKVSLLGKGINKLSKGVQFLGKQAWNLLGTTPHGKIALLAVGALIVGSKVYVDMQKDESVVKSLTKGVSEFYYGEAKTFAAATASWILPGFGTLYATDLFNSKKDSELKTLKQGVLNNVA
jgi:hypothetical protein